MDHLFRSKPSFQSVVDKQRVAHHRLTNTTTRTDPELAHYKRTLEPVPLGDVDITKLPLVRPKAPDLQSRYIVVGEIAQMPGKLLLIDADFGTINIHMTADDVEIIPPG